MDLFLEGCQSVEELEYYGPEPPPDGFDMFIGRNKSPFSSVYLGIPADGIEYAKLFERIEPFVRTSVLIELNISRDFPKDILRKLVSCGVVVRKTSCAE